MISLRDKIYYRDVKSCHSIVSNDKTLSHLYQNLIVLVAVPTNSIIWRIKDRIQVDI
jgi:hypothetical protein